MFDARGLLGKLTGNEPAPDCRPAEPAPPASTDPAVGTTRADIEWDRFLACAVPTPNGLGLYDPSESPDMPAGVTAGLWNALLATDAQLRQRREGLRAAATAGH